MPDPTISLAADSPLATANGPIEFVPDPDQKCPAPGVDGQCEVNDLHPAPPGQRWVQYISKQALKPAPGDAVLQGDVVLGWPAPDSCGSFSGQPYAIWVSDDSDQNGNTVTNAYLDGMNGGGCSVGAVGSAGAAGTGALAAAAAGLLAFVRRRRRSS